MRIWAREFKSGRLSAQQYHPGSGRAASGPAVGEPGGEGTGGILRCAALRAAGTADSAHRGRAGILRLRPAHCVAL